MSEPEIITPEEKRGRSAARASFEPNLDGAISEAFARIQEDFYFLAALHREKLQRAETIKCLVAAGHDQKTATEAEWAIAHMTAAAIIEADQKVALMPQ